MLLPPRAAHNKGVTGGRAPTADRDAAGESWRGLAGVSSGGQGLDEPNAILPVAVVPGRHRGAAGLRVAWLNVEAHPLVEPYRALIHRRRYRADQLAVPCPHGYEEVLI